MADLLHIKPFFIPDNNQFYFQSKDLNSFQRAMYLDTFGFYQNLFGIYGFMQMDRMYNFIVRTPKGHPLVWQELKNCTYNETGSISIGRRELTPQKVYLKEKFCWDEMFDSCFQHMVTFLESGELDMDAAGMMVWNQLVEEMVANAQLGARLSLTAGNLYDVSTVTFSPENTANLTDLFQRVHPSIDGWIKLMMDLANAGYPHLNKSLLVAGDFDSTGYTGSVVDLYDNLHSSAPKKLRQLVNEGGVVQEGRFRFYPLFILSPSMFGRLVAEYKIQSEQVAQNSPRITKRMFGGENTPTPNVVYYIDETPVIPLSDIAGFDPYITADTHFAGIIASGNIQLGTSFASIPSNVEQQDIGIMVERVDSIANGNYGSYHFLSHALMKAAIADPDFATATILATE